MNKATAVLLAVIVAVGGTATARLADDFSAPAFTLGLGTGTPPVSITQTYIGNSQFIVGGERQVTLIKNAGTTDNPTVVGDPTDPYFGFTGSCTYSAGAGGEGELLLTYGATTDLNANFTLGTTTGFAITAFTSDMLAGESIHVEITLTTNGTSDTVAADLTADNHYPFPWGLFPNIDPTDIDQIVVHFTQTAANAPGRTFAIGAIGSGDGSGVVATEQATWGAVKALFD